MYLICPAQPADDTAYFKLLDVKHNSSNRNPYDNPLIYILKGLKKVLHVVNFLAINVLVKCYVYIINMTYYFVHVANILYTYNIQIHKSYNFSYKH
jgi:hypothetical protein